MKIAVPVIQFKWLFLFVFFSFSFPPKAIVDLESRCLQACLLPEGVCCKHSYMAMGLASHRVLEGEKGRSHVVKVRDVG